MLDCWSTSGAWKTDQIEKYISVGAKQKQRERKIVSIFFTKLIMILFINLNFHWQNVFQMSPSHALSDSDPKVCGQLCRQLSVWWRDVQTAQCLVERCDRQWNSKKSPIYQKRTMYLKLLKALNHWINFLSFALPKTNYCHSNSTVLLRL
jgi:hypothetical protein